MARGRQPAQAARGGRAASTETIRRAADDFLSRFGGLVEEVVGLRDALTQVEEENAELRAELAKAAGLFREARALAGNGRTAGRRRGGPAPRRTPAAATARPGRGRPQMRSARRATVGRATPASVTGDVVRAVVAKLGTATAAEIATEIARAGTPVSGRAIRHIAKAAGVVMRPGDDGRMIYSLS
jgi:hypothetical protein